MRLQKSRGGGNQALINNINLRKRHTVKRQLFILTGLLSLVSLSYLYSQQPKSGSWDIYGDHYPATPRVYHDVSNFFIFEGPGNENTGNGWALPQDQLSIPIELKTYIARQFKYVLFDQESFCERTQAWVQDSVRATMTPRYHQEAQGLMNLNSSIIVFPYFCFTIIRPQYPWYSSVPESWFLHQRGQTPDAAHRVRVPEPRSYLMDISNSSWRAFYINWVDSIVHMQTYGAEEYRGIFLDNMTHYPWVTQITRDSIPIGMFDNWYGYLTSFLTDLENRVGTLKLIVCNSLGIDDGNPDTPPLFGSSNGTDVVAQVLGGALMEGFHGTAWHWVLDSTLSIMKWMRYNDKIFLAGTHYTRDLDSHLSSHFGLDPQHENGWAYSDLAYPPVATFYKMQMSYLARFLLVSPGSHEFGYSFQPGVLLDQFIPYYKPWDEKIGSPIETSYVDLGSYYKREFSHAIVYVNKSDTAQLNITLPSGVELYWFPYDTATTQNIEPVKFSTSTITLNKMEGIVIFK